MRVRHDESGEQGRMTVEKQENGSLLVRTILDNGEEVIAEMAPEVLAGLWDEWTPIPKDRFENDEAEAAEEPMRCGDCDRAIYYDYDDDAYHHILEPEWGCFLIPAEEGAIRELCPNCEKKGAILNNPITQEMACMLCSHMYDGETGQTLSQGAQQEERESD